MGRSIPTVWVHTSRAGRWAEVEGVGGQEGWLRVDTTAWREWLEGASSRSFAYPIAEPEAGWIAGYMTVRKERRARGGEYWVAYRRQGGRLRKVYLGRSGQVTGERLAAVAAQFEQAMAGQGAPTSERR